MSESQPPRDDAAKSDTKLAELDEEVQRRGAADAAQLLEGHDHEVVAQVLAESKSETAAGILARLPDVQRQRVLEALPPRRSEQLKRNLAYPEDSIGRLMDAAPAVFPPDLTVRETIERLRGLVREAFITYGWVTDERGVLIGVVVFRELLFADPEQKLSEIMLRKPFSLLPETPLLDAMREVVKRHFPVYPVCDAEGRLLGEVRGQTLFEKQAFEISAQAGSMVGVEKEERLATPWQRSLRFRHPWLQFNLLTAFIAAAVVGLFEGTIERVVVLAVFLPVLAGQSGNTGCQALAVTLRGMTLGELREGSSRMLVAKEALLGLLNGAGVGVSAGLGMLVYAWSKGTANPALLGLIVFMAMIGSCMASGISGALVPMTLRRLGFDPATASSIFLTTATDVASMGLFLGLATMLI